MARPNKPTGAKVLQGTFRRCRANPDEPEPMPIEGIPDPPKKLCKAAKDEWNRVIEYLIINKIIGAEGLSGLEDYCKLYAAIKKEDPLKIPASYHQQLRAMRGSLGLTGDSRAKIHSGASPRKSGNRWENFK